jgi:hypothetical protein
VPAEALGTLLSDPLATYPALAALLLGSVALATGIMRGDALALSRTIPVLWLFVAGGLTYGVVAALPLVPDTVGEGLLGLARFPVYLYALAYGAIPGAVLAALLAAFVPIPHLHPWGPALLGLEVLVVGWLAVWPSPRRHRAWGPIYALLGYVLAEATLGLAGRTLFGETIRLDALWAQGATTAWGVAAAALLLALVSPAAYRSAFPDSRLRPEAYEAERGDRRRGPRRATADALGRPRLDEVDLPHHLERTRRERPRAPRDG